MSAVTIHLFSVRPRRVPAALLRMVRDRRPLRRTHGLAFFKLVGTGHGDTFSLRDANPRRWGLIAAWDDDGALEAFEHGSPTLAAWRRLAHEELRLDLAPVAAHGTWSGHAPFPLTRHVHCDGPVAALTRARIRWRHAPRFWSSVPPVAADLQSRAGLLLRLGFGEAPVGVQGTLSVWESAAALRTFAYEGAAHREAIRRTAEIGWYSEDLFARFRVTGSRGTIDGADPLGHVTTKMPGRA